MDNLHGVLQDIYVLVSKVKFSGEYVERLAPAERQLQISYYERDLEEQKKSQNGSNGVTLPGMGLQGLED